MFRSSKSSPVAPLPRPCGRGRVSLFTWLVPALLVLGACSLLPGPNPPEPPEPPHNEACQALLDSGMQFCDAVEPPAQCSSTEVPCVHNPTSDPKHCEEAPRCDEPPPDLPQPQCPTFTDRGGTLRTQSEACDCYFGQAWNPCPPDPVPTPTPTPPPGPCTIGTPTGVEALAAGQNPTLKVQKIGGKSVSATPIATFGRAYYCSAGVDWAEACAAGRTRGPVTPEGHPQRLACEQHFLQNCGPRFSMSKCTGTGAQCPITFDPFIVLGGVNQNHPTNVKAGCGTQFVDGSDWVKDGEGHIILGSFWWSTAHGKGRIKATDKSGTVVGISPFEIDQ